MSINNFNKMKKKASPFFVFKSLFFLFIVCAGFFLTSCIRNDIPYPTIKLQITNLQFEGQTGNTYINNEEQRVEVVLSETANPENVRITTFSCTEGAKTTLAEGEVLDLSKPHETTLSLYQDYLWTIYANQPVERSFVVEGQIGESLIEPLSKRAIAYVSIHTSLRRIRISKLKLGLEGAQYVPADHLDTPLDFTSARQITVLHRGKEEVWRLFVIQKETLVTTKEVNPWANVAWLTGEGPADGKCGLQYKEADANDWEEVSPEKINYTGSTFTACVNHLKPSSRYVFRATYGDENGEEITFVTTEALPLPNGSFDEWHKLKKVWNPWLEEGTPFWDTGNMGSSTLGESNSQPTDDIWSGRTEGMAASLESKFVGIGSIGKFAAGNLFVGEFVAVDGTNGILNFGQPFRSYPTRLKGYYKYMPAPINYVSSELAHLKGAPDTCSIYIAIGDWKEPVEIRTKPSNRKLFDKNDPNIIAFAEMNSGEAVADYREFSLELDYRSRNRIPTYIIIVASASKYGDFFTGGAGSVLTVDEFSLEYDYP